MWVCIRVFDLANVWEIIILLFLKKRNCLKCDIFVKILKKFYFKKKILKISFAKFLILKIRIFMSKLKLCMFNVTDRDKETLNKVIQTTIANTKKTIAQH